MQINLENATPEEVFDGVARYVWDQITANIARYNNGDTGGIDLIRVPPDVYHLCRMAWTPERDFIMHTERGEWTMFRIPFEAAVRGEAIQLFQEKEHLAPLPGFPSPKS